MIVDDHGTFLTLRTHADIFTQIHVSLEEEYLVLHAPAMSQDVLKIALEDRNKDMCTSMDVRVWNWGGQARIVSSEASAWISRILGKPSHIVRCDEESHNRPVPSDWVSQRTQATAQAIFADGFPYLFVFEESFKDLKTELEGIDFTIDRFRGNMIISGGTPWLEDSKLHLSVEDSLEFDLVKPCTRCKVPTIHPRTAAVDTIVHDVLVRKRSGRVLGWDEPKSFKHSTFFGVNGVFYPDHTMRNVVRSTKTEPYISIGDCVTMT